MDLVRVDFALIPDEPLFGSVVRASQEITDEFYYNQNVIDDHEFPPHLSLHICTVPQDTIQQVADGLDAAKGKIGLPDINPVGVEPAYGGYVMLNIERTTEIMALHEAILELAAAARERIGTDKYGSEYIRDSFVPHVSLAKVDHRDLNSAAEIGRRALGGCHPARTRTLDLCDIGPRSERWKVLVSFPIGEDSSL
ncbi:MAG: 2'-5' RNA ligase family protein [Pseudonocardiaceae bacterium]